MSHPNRFLPKAPVRLSATIDLISDDQLSVLKAINRIPDEDFVVFSVFLQQNLVILSSSVPRRTSCIAAEGSNAANGFLRFMCSIFHPMGAIVRIGDC